MKFKISCAVVCAALLGSSAVAWADASAVMTSAEATETPTHHRHDYGTRSSSGSEADAQGVRGVSRAGLLSDFITAPDRIRVSDFAMLMGPAMGSFSSAAPSRNEPFTGFSMRHDLRLEYQVSDTVSIGPSIGAMEDFYSNPQGSLVISDPTLLVTIDDVNRGRIGSASIRGSVWLQAYAPLSTMSREMHQYTGLSVAYIPTLHFRASRFFLNGVGSVKSNFVENQAQTGVIAPIQWVAALQGNYRISRPTTLFLMDHVNTSCGPQMPMPNVNIGPAIYKIQAKQAEMQSSLVTDGLMAGAHFRVTREVGISPRMDWQVNEPLSTTSVGLNAYFQLN